MPAKKKAIKVTTRDKARFRLLARRLELGNLKAEKRYRRELRAIMRGVVIYYTPKVTRADSLHQDAKGWLSVSAIVTRSIRNQVGKAFDRLWSDVAKNTATWLDGILGRDRETASLGDAKAEAKALAIEGIERTHQEYVEQINATETPPSEERTQALGETAENKAEQSAELGAVDTQGRINAAEQEASQVPAFYWQTQRDSKVRELHVKVGEQVYAWDALPLNEDGEEFAPGEEPNCRCFAVPVLDSAGSIDVDLE